MTDMYSVTLGLYCRIMVVTAVVVTSSNITPGVICFLRSANGFLGHFYSDNYNYSDLDNNVIMALAEKSTTYIKRLSCIVYPNSNFYALILNLNGVI